MEQMRKQGIEGERKKQKEETKVYSYKYAWREMGEEITLTEKKK